MIERGSCRLDGPASPSESLDDSLRRPGIADGLDQADHEVGGIDFKGGGDLQDIEQARVDLAPFQMPDVGAVESGGFAEVLLAKTELESSGTDSPTHFLCWLGRPTRLLHTSDLSRNALDTSTPNT